MASTKKAEQDLTVLKSAVSTTLALINQLQTSSATTEPTHKPKPIVQNVNALKLAHDTAQLIRAHSTKLSLLIINKPFTASAINAVLRELAAGPLPGLASAVEICDAAKYTKAMSAELQYRAKKVFGELGTLVKTIPLDGHILSDDQKNGTGSAAGKGSLASTGVVWEACDAVIELKALGVTGLMIKKAEEYRDLLRDALEELQEWGEQASDDEDGEDHGVHGSEDEGEGAGPISMAQDAVDELFASQRHIPSEDPDKIRPRLDSSQKRLRMIILMYQAVVKRRFKTLPALPHPELPLELRAESDEDPGIVQCLDEVLDVMKKLPEITDELASAFYELDGPEVDKRMDECFFAGFAAAELLIKDWEGQEDEFSTWVSPMS